MMARTAPTKPLAVVFLLAASFSQAQIENFTPVSDEMLNNPPTGEWLSWRGTPASWGYSPLDQINTDNVDQLQLKWSFALDNTAAVEAAPLIHDGIMFIPAPKGVIQALDAANGDLLWEYRPESSRGFQQKNIALYGDMIFASTGNASIRAIDARSGLLVWETQVADPALGYRYTAGPIIANGTLVTGITGCDRYKEDVCFITGHDPKTGEEKWRTSTIARPGEPGGDTWGDLPLKFRAGSDAWIAGSYDPETNLVYWGTAQAKPWVREVRGTDGDALYTSSTLALDPETGTMVWYYQHLPGETHDMDDMFENILLDVDGRKSLFKMGKLGILWQLDRETGEFIKGTDIGYQNILNVDQDTGEITYRDGMVPRIGEEIEMCPSTAGFKSWRAMAYSPDTNAMYIPIELSCGIYTFGPTERELGGGGLGPYRRVDIHHPESGGNLGELLALDIPSGEVKWRHRTRAAVNTAALTTAGGLVFIGDWDRRMSALDAESGEVLWQTRLATSNQGFPISYSVDGKQYIAMPTGFGGGSWSLSVPPQLTPEIHQPRSGSSINVFALPD